MNINKVEQFATDIANLAFANINEKHRIKEQIMQMIALSCIAYSKDNDFKKQVDGYYSYKFR